MTSRNLSWDEWLELRAKRSIALESVLGDESPEKDTAVMGLLRYMDWADDITISKCGRDWCVTIDLRHTGKSPSLSSAIAAVFLAATCDDYKDNGPPTAIVGTTLK